MRRETVVRAIGVLVALATVTMTVAAIFHEFITG
jgi:hypothetical protein